MEPSASGVLLQRLNQQMRMRHNHKLRPLRGHRDQARERGQQIRMQAGLRLVQHHQFRRPRRQQRRRPQQKAQRSVGKLGGSKWPQQPVLPQLHFEPSGLRFNLDAAARKSIVYRAFERFRVAKFHGWSARAAGKVCSPRC